MKIYMDRKDMANNLETHWEKFKTIPEETNGRVTSLTAAMDYYSPAKNEKEGSALLEVMGRRGLRAVDTKGEASSTIREIFEMGELDRALAVEYFQECFSSNIGRGVPIIDDDNVDFAATANPQDGLPEPLATVTTDLQVRRKNEPRIKLRDVVAAQRNLTGSIYRPAIVEEPEGIDPQDVSEGDRLPIVRLKFGSTEHRTKKKGYQLDVSYEFDSNTPMRMSAVAEVQRKRAAIQEIAIVDEVVQLIGNGAEAYAFSATPSPEEVIGLFLETDDRYTLDTLIGTPAALRKYFISPVFYSSNNQMTGIPGRRTLYDYISDVEMIGKKNSTNVATLEETGSKPVMIAFDKNNCVDLLVPRRSMIQESDRDIGAQVIQLTNSYQYGVALRADANNCRYRVVFG